MKKVASLLSLLILFNICVLAQNDYNKTDDLGRRQGKWVDYHDNGHLIIIKLYLSLYRFKFIV